MLTARPNNPRPFFVLDFCIYLTITRRYHQRIQTSNQLLRKTRFYAKENSKQLEEKRKAIGNDPEFGFCCQASSLYFQYAIPLIKTC